MKKTLCIVLAILMLTAVFMGCSKKAEDDENVVKSIELQLEDREDKTVIEEVLENKPDPLRVCVDLDFTDRVQGEMETSGLMLGVLSNISLEGGRYRLRCPAGGSARERGCAYVHDEPHPCGDHERRGPRCVHYGYKRQLFWQNGRFYVRSPGKNHGKRYFPAAR